MSISTLVSTAKGRDQLLDIGLLLVLAVMLHNLLGYVLVFGLVDCCGERKPMLERSQLKWVLKWALRWGSLIQWATSIR
ncbi:MAG: hypothetical protein R3C28_29165 [Pirellulaceae bacterium]